MERYEEEKAFFSHIISKHTYCIFLENLVMSIKNVNVQTWTQLTTQLGNHPTNVFQKHFNGKKPVTTQMELVI